MDAIFAAQDVGGKASPEQVTELNRARDGFEEVRPHGWRDAEAAYKKNPELASEAAGGKVIRAIQALQLESEIRTERSLDPGTRADRFVERWHRLDQTRQRQYQAGDMAAYQSTRTTMADMAKGLERDPQIESILRNRKRELGIGIESAAVSATISPSVTALAGVGDEVSEFSSTLQPSFLRCTTPSAETLLRKGETLP